MIELQNVTKLYGPVIGVNDITLSMSPRRSLWIARSKRISGKSTLLNLIMGQLVPTIGSVTVFGGCPQGNDALYRRLGYCPSSEGMYSGITAFEWVCYLQAPTGHESGRRLKNGAEQGT